MLAWGLRAGFGLLSSAAVVGLIDPDLKSIAGADAGLAGLGLGLDQVSVSGQHFTDAGDIFEALDLGNVRSLLAFDSVAARTRLERLPWVEGAVIASTYPGRLDIHVTERKAFARWRRGDKTVLIDTDGRFLGVIEPGASGTLPLVEGEGANEEAGTILASVARYQGLRDRFVSASRIGERRWSLKLTGGVTLQLPADRETIALDAFFADAELAALLDSPAATIDLRAPGRVALRPQAVASGPPTGAND